MSLIASGFVAVLGVAGVGGILSLFGTSEEWWLGRVETALEAAWNGYADVTLVGGLFVVGIAALGQSLSDPTSEPAYGLLVVAFICLGAAFLALVGSQYA